MLKPKVAAPAAWNETAPQNAVAVSADWWSVFGSAELQDLVEAALSDSPDLSIAIERVVQAEAQARIAGASLFPTLNLGLGMSTRNSNSEGASTTTNSSSTTLSASYELDVWGRNAAGLRGANASLQATTYDRDTARLTLIAGVATGYFQLLSLRSRLAIAQENLAIAERVQN
ncbi:MAG: TolC family protein, partial [Betaproteobacteria bacterium]|nr:TolC family protein [Betaproteobacteria bacterium]